MGQKKGSLKSAFRNARYLYFPFFMGERKLDSASIMTGVLPGTHDWFELYSDTNTRNDDHIWNRFHRRHEVAKERAELLRSILGNEALILRQEGHEVPVSLLNPEIRLTGCVGRSMHMSDIQYMDVLAIYPASEKLQVDLLGEARMDDSGTEVFDNFRIHIGNGVIIEPRNIVELKYLDHVMAKAVETCPPNLKEWAQNLHKVRQIDCIKVAKDGTKTVGVSTNRDGLEPGIDHALDNIQGRVIARYERSAYESRIKNVGKWDGLSAGARYANFLKPDCNWDEKLATFSPAQIETIEATLFGLDGADGNEAELFLKSLVLQDQIGGLSSPTPGQKIA